jgi:glutathione reductase (NADPH)
MKNFDYDLIVIGAGSAGVRASRMAARTGARVAVVEAHALGGTCVNIGCVPKKLFYYGAEFNHAWTDAAGYGWQVQAPTFNWQILRDNKTKEIERLNGVYQRILETAKVKILQGYGKITGEHEVTIDQKTYTAERILIATGNTPLKPTFPGAELASVSDDMFYLKEFPKRIIIIGGGYIASEFAGIFAGLGAEVTQLYRGALFLRGFDDDVRHHVAEEMRKYLDLRYHTDVIKLERSTTGITAYLNTGDTVEADLVLYAAGRKPHTAELGLKKVGVAMNDNGAVIVNDYWQTSVPSIYALGDVIDRFQLTPVALAEAMAFVKTIYENKPTKLDYSLIPTAVFCDPNIGTVGLTEHQAREKYKHIKIFKSKFKPLKNTLSGRDTQTFVKLVVDSETDKVLGLHVVGEAAGEIVQGFAVALTAGATKAMFDSTIGIHPTTAEELVTLREPVN